jgi:serine/threonine-protein kinase
VTLSGRYTLERSLATGGMGTVWLARDDVLDRPVAVKLLNEGLLADEHAAERFRREAMTAAAVTHPHMANVFDYLDHDGRPGIVMEYVEGETLATRLARCAPLPADEAVHIAVGVLEALEAAHAAGIVHRDIKPGNILLATDGSVKVTDFGIARALGSSDLTQTGMLMGTPHYIAPEQVAGEPASPASDVYAVGAVLYEMLTARKPFEADTPVAVAMARLHAEPPLPSTLHASIPPGLEQVAMRALAREPGQRFASADEMRRALTGVSNETQLLRVLPTDQTIAFRARPAPVKPASVLGARLRPWFLPAAAVALIAALASLLVAAGGDGAVSAGPPTRSPTRAPATPTASEPAPERPRTVAAAVAALIDIVRAGDRRGEIDDEVADDLVASAREIDEKHAKGDDGAALEKFRSMLDVLEEAHDDGEISSRRLTLVGAAMTDLITLLNDAAASSGDGGDDDSGDDDKKKGKGKGKGHD